MDRQSGSIKSFRLPVLSGVEMLTGKHISNAFRRHVHKTYIIGIVEQGKRIISYPGGSVQISEGEMFIINPGRVHSCFCASPSGHSYKVLSIPSRTMQLIASQISGKNEKVPCFKRVHYRNDELSQKFLRLFHLMKDPGPGIRVESGLFEFLTGLSVCFSEDSSLTYRAGEQKGPIKRVCDYISRHFTENLSLDTLAGIACLSPFHFQREFKKYMGITPREYLSDFRIRRSKRMLMESDDIADVAIQLGFFDQSHFSRIFRKTVGVPPGKYQKTNKRH